MYALNTDRSSGFGFFPVCVWEGDVLRWKKQMSNLLLALGAMFNNEVRLTASLSCVTGPAV